jgi:multiple sugar transport system substrate-binding protein
MTQTKRITRRTMLKGSLAVAGGAALAPFLAACGGTQEQAQAGLDPNQRVTIDYWFYEQWSKGVEPLLARFRREHPNVRVNARSYPDYPSIIEAVQASLAAQEPPTLAHVGYPWLRYAAAALPHPTIEEVAQSGDRPTDWLDENFAPNLLELGQVDGALHGVPQVMGEPALVYNRDLLGQAGLDQAPRTWEEVHEYARRIKDSTDEFGLYVGEFPGWYCEEALVGSNGGQMLVESGGGFRTGVDGPEAVEALQLVADMVLRDETAAHLTAEQGIQSFSSGEIAMIVNSAASYFDYQQNASFEVGLAVFPSFGDQTPRLPIGGATNMIFANDQNQQLAALELVRFFSTPESFTTFVEETHLLPPRPEMFEDPQYLKPLVDREPAVAVSAEALEYAAPLSSWPGEDGLQATQVLVDARSRYLSGQQDVQTAVGEAAEQINELIGS